MSRDADRAAVEQCIWWQAHNFMPYEALQALGMDWPANKEADWHGVHLAAALMWRQLPPLLSFSSTGR